MARPATETEETFVFLGPSLPREAAERILPANYLPPAAMGDVYALLPLAPRRIVLIDGVFHSTPSIWQRELVAAIEDGVEVVGASSMGALRAAELHALGMIGVGKIFAWYRDGLIDGDDEVALRHGDAESGYRAMSEPLVNIRATLAALRAAGAITAEDEARIVAFARELYYPERNLRALERAPVVAAWPEDVQARFRSELRERAINQKARDAARALEHCAGAPSRGARASASSPVRGSIWGGARFEHARLVREGGACRGREVVREALEARRDDASWRGRLATRAFLLDLAERLAHRIPDDVAARAVAARGLSVEGRAVALRRVGLGAASFEALARDRAEVDWLIGQGAGALGFAWDPGAAARREASFAPALGAAIAGPVALAERRLLLAWAEVSGATCPPEEEQALEARVLAASGDPDERREWVRERATAAWMLARGPRYFGLSWDLEVAALNDLQLEGLEQDEQETLARSVDAGLAGRRVALEEERVSS